MRLCAWGYNVTSDIRCKNEAEPDEAMCKEHNEALDALAALDNAYLDKDGHFKSRATFNEYNAQWEILVKRAEEIGR